MPVVLPLFIQAFFFPWPMFFLFSAVPSFLFQLELPFHDIVYFVVVSPEKSAELQTNSLIPPLLLHSSTQMHG